MRQFIVEDNSLPSSSINNFNKLKEILLKSFNKKLDINTLSSVLKINETQINKVFTRFLFFYLIKRLVNSAKYSNLISIFDNNPFNQRTTLVEQLLNNYSLNPNLLEQIADILITLEANINTNLVKVKMSKQNAYTTKLINYAMVNNFRCYICGSEVDYTNSSADNYRGVEHSITRSFGGDKSTKNLFISCKNCNEAKKNYISWIESDFHNKHSIFYNIYKKENNLENDLSILENETDKILFKQESFKSKITQEIIYIVSSMNNYKCSLCGTDNDISHSTYITKKDENDYCHPLNLMTVCDNCLNDIEDDFTYIIKKRISNVNN